MRGTEIGRIFRVNAELTSKDKRQVSEMGRILPAVNLSGARATRPYPDAPRMSSIAIEDGLKVAVLLPCPNQAATIGAVVRGFAGALPAAHLYVFDNNSTDDTARAAAREGATVHREARPGKGNVVRRMFADVDADVYVLADPARGYDPADASSLVNALITEHADMVVGTRHANTNGLGARQPQRPFGEKSFDWLYRHF